MDAYWGLVSEPETASASTKRASPAGVCEGRLETTETCGSRWAAEFVRGKSDRDLL